MNWDARSVGMCGGFRYARRGTSGIELTLLAQLAESTNHIERAASLLRHGQQQEGATP